jgi:hypothetical protein
LRRNSREIPSNEISGSLNTDTAAGYPGAVITAATLAQPTTVAWPGRLEITRLAVMTLTADAHRKLTP